jgi:hypothetical protein
VQKMADKKLSLVEKWIGTEYDILRTERKRCKFTDSEDKILQFQQDFENAMDNGDVEFVNWIIQRQSFRLISLKHLFRQTDLIERFDVCQILLDQMPCSIVMKFVLIIIGGLYNVEYKHRNKLQQKAVTWFWQLMHKHRLDRQIDVGRIWSRNMSRNVSFGLMFLRANRDIRYIVEWSTWAEQIHRNVAVINELIELFPELRDRPIVLMNYDINTISSLLMSDISLDVIINMKHKPKYFYMSYYYEISIMLIRNHADDNVVNATIREMKTLIQRGRLPIYGTAIPEENFWNTAIYKREITYRSPHIVSLPFLSEL